MFAAVFHIKEPLPRLDKDRGFLVADVPPDIFKIVSG
jgi:hypothetical protein